MAYTGPSMTDLRQIVHGMARRQLASASDLDATLLGLAINEALRTIQDAHDWRVLEQTVTVGENGSALCTTAHSRTVALPARYKDSARLYYAQSGATDLLPVPGTAQGQPITLEWIRLNHPDTAVESDTPEAMCIRGESIVIVPTPASVLSLTLDCRLYAPDLDDSNPRNWFTMHLPLPLCQLATGHALQLLHEEEWAQSWFTLGLQAVQQRVGRDLGEAVSRAPASIGREPA